jgi:hypothetical protein
MMRCRAVIIFLALATLAGCTSRSGCNGYACERPDATDRQLVVWWPADMRQGLNDSDPKVDFTVVPLKD